MCLALAAAFHLAPVVYRHLESFAARLHQESVRKTLAEWQHEYSQVSDDTAARRAVQMLEYVKHYYVVGEWYRSNEATEAALEAQRSRTLASITAALEAYSGKKYGSDIRMWELWSMHLNPGESQLPGSSPAASAP
jgi:ribosomal protein L16 Arg81 hydroxylase